MAQGVCRAAVHPLRFSPCGNCKVLQAHAPFPACTRNAMGNLGTRTKSIVRIAAAVKIQGCKLDWLWGEQLTPLPDSAPLAPFPAGAPADQQQSDLPRTTACHRDAAHIVPAAG